MDVVKDAKGLAALTLEINCHQTAMGFLVTSAVFHIEKYCRRNKDRKKE
jgi:hypothetical protein